MNGYMTSLTRIPGKSLAGCNCEKLFRVGTNMKYYLQMKDLWICIRGLSAKVAEVIAVEECGAGWDTWC